MQTVEGRILESLRSAPQFLDAHADRLGGIAQCGQRKKLDDIVVEAEGLVSAQSGSALAGKGATQKHGALREVLLRDHMAPIAGIAAAELPNTPELQPLKMPKRKLSVERLRAAALGMAKAAAPYADTFVSSGLPTDFIDQLVAAANAIVGTTGVQKQSIAARTGATKGLGAALRKGRKCVRALDRMVKSALKGDPVLVAAWRTASRVAMPATGPVSASETTSAPAPAAQSPVVATAVPPKDDAAAKA